MAKERTEKSKYQSPTTGEYCTEAQYITELFLRREIQKDKKSVPVYKFWNKEPWKKKFVIISIKVNKMLKKYAGQAIIRALEGNKWVFSPHFPKFESMVQKEQKKIDNESDKIIEVNHTPESKPMKSFKGKNKKAKFKDL